MFIRLTVFLLFLCFVEFHTSAQQPYFKKYTVEDGLNNNDVFDIFIDENDNFWVASNGGLQKFNGNKFQNIYNEEGELESLHNILTDGEGGIWCSSFSGKIYKVENNRLITVFEDTEPKNTFIQLMKFSDSLFFINASKDFYLNPLTSEVISVDFGDFTYQDNQKIKSSKLPLYHLIGVGERKYFVSSTFYGLAEVKEDRLICHASHYGINEHLQFFKNATRFYSQRTGLINFKLRYLEKDEKPSPKDSIIYDFKNTRPNNVSLFDDDMYVSTTKGIYHFKQSSGGWQFHKQILPKYNFSNVLKVGDYLWGSTLGNGIVKIPNSEVAVMQSFTSKSTIEFIRKINNYKILYHDSLPVHEIPNQTNHDNLKRYSSKNILKTKDAQLIAKYFKSEIQQHSYALVFKDIAYLNDSTFISANGLGVHKIYFQSNQIKRRETISHSRATQVDRINDSSFYFTDLNGLFYAEGSKIEKILYKNKPIHSYSIEMGENGDCYAALKNEILILKDRVVVDVIKLEEYIHDYRINSLYYDAGELLISCSYGFITYDIATQKIKHFTKKDGLSENHIKGGVRYGEGYIIATANSILIIPIDESISVSTLPKITLANVFCDGEKLNELPFVVTPGNSLIEFEFNINDLNLFKYHSYKYKLNEGQWITKNLESNKIRFLNLEPDSYDLSVIALDEYNNEGEPLNIHFVTKGYFYKSLWFNALVIVLIIGGIFYFYFSRLRKREKDQSKELKVKVAEMKAIKSQMNPHFLFNALNSIQELILHEDFRKSNRYLSKFSELVRYVLEYSEKDEIELEKEVEMLRLYVSLEELRIGDDILCEWKIDISEKVKEIQKVPPMLIQPFVENAFKHGLLHKVGEKKMIIRLTHDLDYLIVGIEDNGIGREKSHEINKNKPNYHESFGSTAISNRVKLINSQIEKPIIIDISNGTNGLGTKVIIKIPLNYHQNY